MAAATARASIDNLCALGVADLGHLFRTRELSPVDVTRAVLDRIEHLNPKLGAFLMVMEDSALAAARVAQMQLASGVDLGPLHGIPVSVKDLIAVKGTRTTAASRVLIDAPLESGDATVIQRLRKAGAIIVGKTNLHEFALGAPDIDGPFATVQNPRRIGHTPGSSSSGSAAAIAAGLGPLAVATDTGGSIRHPAGLCGVVGLRPTLGRVSLHGVIPLSHHLDTVGLLGRSVADVAAGLAAVAGFDAADPTSVLLPTEDYLAAMEYDICGLRLGLPSNEMFRFGGPAARSLFERSLGVLVEVGLVMMPVTLPRAEELNEAYQRIMGVDMLSYHEHQHFGCDALYGRDLQSRMAAARAVTASQYARALIDGDEVHRAWLRLFERVDMLAVPGNVASAPRHSVETVDIEGKAYPARIVASPFSRIFSVVGFPSLSVPIGDMPDGLPISMQLVAPPFAEARLFAVAHALEQALGQPVKRWGIDVRQGA